MRFLTPAQVVNGKLCDRGLYPLALRGVDYTPVSEEQTVRDLFRFRHDGINLIRLNIDDSVLSGGIGDSIACGVSGTWVATAIQEKLGENYGCCKLPTFTCDGKQVQMGSFLGCKIYGVNSQTDYPVKAYARMGDRFDGADLVAGACYHNYGGTVKDIEKTVVWGNYQEKELLFSEASIGEWNDGRNLAARLAADMNEIIIEPSLRRFRGSIVWNFMLDTNKEPYLPGGCSTCYGAVDLNASNHSDYTFNSHYIIMAQTSAAVKPGAHRVDTEGWWTDGLSYAAYRNPDNTGAVLLSNTSDRSITARVRSAAGNTYSLDVPPRGVVAARLDLDKDETTLIAAPAADDSAGPVRYFNLLGREVSAPSPGSMYTTSRGQKIIYR